MPKHRTPLNRATLSAFARDAMRDFSEFDPALGWDQVKHENASTQRRYGEFVMLLRLVEEFDLDMNEKAPPYPWCRTPAECTQLGRCPRKPSCGD